MASLSTPIAQARSASTRWRAYVALAIGVICITWSAILARWAAIPGTSSAFYRVLIATLILAPFWLHRQRVAPALRPSKHAIWIGILGGVMFAGDLGMYNTSVMLTSATNATLLGNNAPLWVALGAWIFFRQRPSVMYWIGLVLALVGTVAIVGSDMIKHPTFSLGDFFAFAAAVCFAGYLLAVERVRASTDTLTLLMITISASTVTLFIIALITHAPLQGFSLTTWGSLIALGLVSQVCGYVALTYALGHLPATVTSVCLLLQAPLTALLAIPLLGESVTEPQILGGLLVLIGVYLVSRPNAA